ncbi:hypothetical protein SAY86_031024 [Trapa natans]|uniref:Isopenicillin N synthase-like Fe(2+) 2OG dioxygenase domain-containing protein n=1 Tax=Trapa natans TaxID=22666 RepID=A0AAN7MTJ2_TRANT|nr:hypothetical protein SAY86_031024 [Trapa natans]
MPTTRAHPGAKQEYRQWSHNNLAAGSIRWLYGPIKLISNGRFKSIYHRVLAKSVGTRVSVPCFFRAHFETDDQTLYGPIKELLSDNSPPIHEVTTQKDCLLHLLKGPRWSPFNRSFEDVTAAG